MPRQIEIRFVSNNPHKIGEAKQILGEKMISVVESRLKIEELQTTDTHKLVHDKLLKAYREIGRPLFVEHTGLYLAHLNGMPGGLTQIFWDTLKAERFAELFGKAAPNNNATARTTIGYCDGRKVYDFDGEIAGRIADAPGPPAIFSGAAPPTGRAHANARRNGQQEKQHLHAATRPGKVGPSPHSGCSRRSTKPSMLSGPGRQSYL